MDDAAVCGVVRRFLADELTAEEAGELLDAAGVSFARLMGAWRAVAGPWRGAETAREGEPTRAG